MRIHKEGYKILTFSTSTLLILNLVLHRFAGKSLFFYFFLSVSIVLFLIILNFFRSPSRVFTGSQEGTVIAPADGTIVVIEEVFENEFLHEKRIQVSIFMSLFNAHINWIPVDGKISHYSHQNGRFMAAYLPKSSIENERSTVVIDRENGDRILIRQIAGAMAKRIVTYAEEGRECHINEQLGFIKFGSRVDLFLPLNYEVKVEMDQKIYGNRTIIAQVNN